MLVFDADTDDEAVYSMELGDDPDNVVVAFEDLASRGEHAPLDLAAEELRLAADELGRITGRIDVEELLDVIFSDFCIGK